jgi:hypothetical protein
MGFSVMTDRPDTATAKVAGITVSNLGAETAPFIYFDGVMTFGMNKGAVQIELAANVINPTSDGGTRNDVVVTAHIRCSPAAAMDLQQAIGKAILMGMPVEPTPEGKAN